MPTYFFKKHDVYFVRVPKTASASIMRVLGKPSNRHWDNPLPWKSIDERLLSRSFAIVRHPVERFRSAWGMWTARAALSFEDALAFSERYPENNPTKKAVVHFTPMSHPHFQLRSVSKIWKYEELAERWPEICEYLGLPLSTVLPHLKEKYDKPELTPKQAKRVIYAYGHDFAQFGYPIE